MSGLYVFALVSDAVPSFTAAGHHVEFVEAAGICAAVERRTASPVVSENALRAQNQVVAEIANRVGAVLPSRFGSFIDERELGRVIDQRRPAIVEALQLFQGRRQMTARLLVPEPLPVIVPPTAVPTGTTGTAYLQGRRDAALPQSPPAVLKAVSDAVRNCVVTERIEAGRGRVAASLYHLVGIPDVESYRRAVAPLQSVSESALQGAHLSISGPWAPFAFAPDLWA